MGETSAPDGESIVRSDWIRELERVRREVAVPGYWIALEENCAQWAKEMSVCPYWSTAKNSLRGWSASYRQKTGGDLLTQPGLPDFTGKTVSRIQTKLDTLIGRQKLNPADCFRQEGPPIPLLNDLVRTRVTCKFIDGVEYLGDRFYELAQQMNGKPTRSRAGRIEGYYAQHITFEGDVFFRMGGQGTPGRITSEVQLATDLSTRIWEATHAIYEENRDTDELPEDWQWNPDDVRFVSRQLGHMIHLADGLLVRLRETRRSADRKAKK